MSTNANPDLRAQLTRENADESSDPYLAAPKNWAQQPSIGDLFVLLVKLTVASIPIAIAAGFVMLILAAIGSAH
jgi:hypothetical protein